MKIALDIRGITDHPAGKGVWTKSVLEALLQLEPHHEYILLCHDTSSKRYASHPRVKCIQVKGRGLWWHWQAYQTLLKEKVELYLATESYLIPYFHDPKKLQVALVVHDLVVFKSPSKHQPKATWIERLTLKKAAQKSRWIFTVSEHTKQDLEAQYPALKLAEKTTVVYAGVRDFFTQTLSPGEREKVLEKFRLKMPFLLMASTLEPRKNIKGAVEAYAHLPHSIHQKYPLVIAGKKGWYYEEIFQTVQALKMDSHVYFLGYVSDEELLALMQSAYLFFFPSFYEGFGLPVVEAMANGLPVITSKMSSLPEVGGQAVSYVDPYNVTQMSEALLKLMTDPVYHQKLKTTGKQQAKQFSWAKTVQRMMKALKC